MSPVAARRPCDRPGCRGFKPCPDHSGHTSPGQTYADRLAASPWRALYDTRQWRRLSRAVRQDEPLCRSCMSRNRAVPATVVDHITPHRGNRAVFFDRHNLQPLCKACHDAKTGHETRERRHR